MAAVPSQGRASATVVSAAPEAARLYEAYRRRVLGYCLTFLRNREEAEDAVQTTFLDAFRALERGVVPRVEDAWLLAVARNVCLARRRSRGRRYELETPHDPLTLQDAWAAPEHSDGLDGIGEALARLPDQQRRAILLREWRGFSYREIADELGLSGAAVETLIFRARRSLARELDPDRASVASRLRGIALGPFAGLKSLLSGGTAAKLAAAAATVAVVASAGGDAPRRVEPAAAPKPALAAPAPAPAPERALSAAPSEVAEHASLARRTAAPAPAPARTGRKPVAGESPAPEPTENGGGALAPVADAVDDTAASLGIDVQVPDLPVEPPVNVPELPVELPPPPELPLPDVPLP